jgi:orotidine-5'-phosphate decarboxylase
MVLSPVIVALDFPGRAEAMALVATLGAQGKQVFLDLKLHEIPNSVAGRG